MVMDPVLTDEDEATPLPFNEMTVGDLVFLEPTNEPLPAMIKKYDRGSFSHVGIVVEPGVMASSRTNRLSLEREHDRDFGGIRLNAIADLMIRKPHIGRPRADPDGRIDAATRMLDLLEYGVPPRDRSGFSYVKLFLVAAALDAVKVGQDERARNAILARASRAAALWAAAEQARHGQLQSFFCSEAICVAYPSTTFTFRDLWTFPAPSIDTTGLPSMSDVISLINALLESLRDSRITPEQKESVEKVAVTLLVHDPRFLGEAAAALLDQLRPHGEAEAPVAPGPDDPLPTSLVTPRMLQHHPFLAWVRPLASPGGAGTPG